MGENSDLFFDLLFKLTAIGVILSALHVVIFIATHQSLFRFL